MNVKALSESFSETSLDNVGHVFAALDSILLLDWRILEGETLGIMV